MQSVQREAQILLGVLLTTLEGRRHAVNARLTADSTTLRGITRSARASPAGERGHNALTEQAVFVLVTTTN